MSAYARNYVYFIDEKEAKRIAEPTITKERLEAMRREVEKYLPKKDDKKD